MDDLSAANYAEYKTRAGELGKEKGEGVVRGRGGGGKESRMRECGV